jgi:transposase
VQPDDALAGPAAGEGLTRKKKSVHADERDRPDVKRKRRSFRRRVRRIEPGRLKFIDESGANTAMARTHAWSPRGVRAVGSAPGRWESFTVIAASGLDGVRAPLVLPGAVDAAAFDSYVADVLAPAPRPGDVVVWDNLPTHQGRAAAAAVRGAGARLMFPSPYSPDYTPIERLWSKIKTYLRRVASRSKDSLSSALGEAPETVTAQDIIGWFEHAGLCATHS